MFIEEKKVESELFLLSKWIAKITRVCEEEQVDGRDKWKETKR